MDAEQPQHFRFHHFVERLRTPTTDRIKGKQKAELVQYVGRKALSGPVIRQFAASEKTEIQWRHERSSHPEQWSGEYPMDKLGAQTVLKRHVKGGAMADQDE